MKKTAKDYHNIDRLCWDDFKSLIYENSNILGPDLEFLAFAVRNTTGLKRAFVKAILGKILRRKIMKSAGIHETF